MGGINFLLIGREHRHAPLRSRQPFFVSFPDNPLLRIQAGVADFSGSGVILPDHPILATAVDDPGVRLDNKSASHIDKVRHTFGFDELIIHRA